MSKVIIIGAGVAGLATAIRLSAKGYSVEVYEKNEGPGGKLRQKTIANYRFDLGPSLFTRPDLVEELIKLAGKNPVDCFPYLRLATLCHYFYPNGKVFHAPATVNAFASALENAVDEPSENTLAFFDYALQINKVAGSVFLNQSLHKLSTYLKKDTLKSMLQLHKIDAFRTMDKANKSFFITPEAVQLFNRYATYNGSNPYQTPGTLNLISTLEMQDGAYFPKHGMYQITQILFELGKELGVVYHFNKGVKKINETNNKVTGITLESEEVVPAEIVVSNMDAFFSYKHLLNNTSKAQKIDKLERSGSALIFYWGMNAVFKELDVHNIFFSADYEKEFDHMFKLGTMSDDPTVYIHISSKINKEDAPLGCENWFVMVNAPANPAYFTTEMVARIKQQIVTKLSQMLGTDVSSFIECEEVLTPGLIESRTMSYKGALYGTASNHMFSAFFRPPNFDNKIKNLFFCGGSVHPGGGIPLCLLSAKITDDLIS